MGVLTPSSSRTHKISQGNDPDEVRPVSAAVAAIFGPTPQYFREYLLLQLEEHIRFDQFHVHDFQRKREFWTEG